MPTPLPTFEVDKEGLRRVLARRGMSWILPELLQNAWDEDATEVAVNTQWGDGVAYFHVEDDDPDGFVNLSHAYTLYAESEKKTGPDSAWPVQRGGEACDRRVHEGGAAHDHGDRGVR